MTAAGLNSGTAAAVGGEGAVVVVANEGTIAGWVAVRRWPARIAARAVCGRCAESGPDADGMHFRQPSKVSCPSPKGEQAVWWDAVGYRGGSAGVTLGQIRQSRTTRGSLLRLAMGMVEMEAPGSANRAVAGRARLGTPG